MSDRAARTRGTCRRGRPDPRRAGRRRLRRPRVRGPDHPPDARASSSWRSPTARSRRPSAPIATPASTTPGHVSSAAELDVAIRNHRPVVTDDPTLLTDAAGIEAIVEATGEVEFGAGVAVRAIDAGKHLVLINAELDSCLGPLLKTRADAAGVVLTDMAGDQPAVIMDLIDEVRLLGFRPILAGNIKSLLDHKRTPDDAARPSPRHTASARR